MKSNFTFILTIMFLFFFIGCNSETEQIEDIEQIDLQCSQNNGFSIEQNFTITSIEDAILFLENPYKEIIGEIEVNNLNDISFLNCVEKITSLKLRYCEIENLNDLNNLIELTELHIANMPILENLEGLNSLDEIKFLHIYNNPSLTNLNGLESLSTIGGIHIEKNENLQSLSGLENVTTNVFYDGAQYDFPQSWRWRFVDNPSLTSIAALNNIIGELISSISIYQCPNLVNLGVFESVTESSGLSINFCSGLTSVNCFPNLTETGSIGIFESSNIQNISFPSLENLGYLGIERNNSLYEIDFSSLIEITGEGNGDYSMSFSGNDSLTTLSGIENMEYTEKKVSINPFYSDFENPLESVCALRKLYLNQIENGVNDNEIDFSTRCWGNAGFPYSDISQFDSICECF